MTAGIAFGIIRVMKKFPVFLLVLNLLFLSSSFLHDACAESLYIGGVSFDVPVEWIETPVTSPMRTAQYKVPKAGSDTEDGELAVFFFGEGQGGDTNSNILRWQQQFESSDEDANRIEKKVINGVSVTSVFLEGTYNPGSMSGGGQPKKDYAMNGAIITGDQGQVFIKLIAPRETMAAASESFQKLLSSIQSTLGA